MFDPDGNAERAVPASGPVDPAAGTLDTPPTDRSRTGPVWPQAPVRRTPEAPNEAPVTATSRAVPNWFGTAVVAAVVGALVGGGIVWATKGSTTAPSTVTIKRATGSHGAPGPSSGRNLPALVRAVSPSVVSINVTSAQGEDQGTGMIIAPDGLIITNNHVVALAEASVATITVTQSGTRRARLATLLAHDAADDVALLQINGASGLPAVTFGNSTNLAVGDEVIAIGNALGLSAGTPTVTQGIVSALGRTVTAVNDVTGTSETLHNMIQTDAPINPGNSGGPLLDDAGHVIGMNTAVAGSSNGASAQGIGFAIPSSRIESLLPTLLRQRAPTHPLFQGSYLGIFIETVDPAIAQESGLPTSRGALVSQVVAGEPASLAGMRVGDVIIAVGGTAITSAAQVSSILRKTQPGTQLTVEVVRPGGHVTLHVTTGAVPRVG